MLNGWLLLIAGAFVILIIMLVINVFLFRASDIGQSARQRREASPPPKVKNELMQASDLLAEIEHGRGQAPEVNADVDFAAVHQTLLARRENPFKTGHASAEVDLPLHIQQGLDEMKGANGLMAWLVLRGKEVMASSSPLEEEIISLFDSWRELAEQTESTLVLHNLSELKLSGQEGTIRIKRDEDYMLVALLEHRL